MNKYTYSAEFSTLNYLVDGVRLKVADDDDDDGLLPFQPTLRMNISTISTFIHAFICSLPTLFFDENENFACC